MTAIVVAAFVAAPTDGYACSRLSGEYVPEAITPEWEPPVLDAPKVISTRAENNYIDCGGFIELVLADDLSDDPDRVGYEVSLASGEPPGTLSPTLPARLRSFPGGVLGLDWFGSHDGAPPFTFSVKVRAIDAAGNRSESSAPAQIVFNGDPVPPLFDPSPFDVVGDEPPQDLEGPTDITSVDLAGEGSGGGTITPLILLWLALLRLTRGAGDRHHRAASMRAQRDSAA